MLMNGENQYHYTDFCQEIYELNPSKYHQYFSKKSNKNIRIYMVLLKVWNHKSNPEKKGEN